MKEFEAVITGRVQRVMFRDFCQRKARSLGVTGTVQNIEDGGVRVIAQGNEAALHDLIKKLNRGSLASRVDDVVVSWREPTCNFTDFSIVFNNNLLDQL